MKTAYFTVLWISFLCQNLWSSQLEQLISGEIKNDIFYEEIYKLAQHHDVHTILEIGSSSGEGSTEAFVKGITQNPNQPKLFCMEVSKIRFAALQNHYKDHPQVVCYNVSSVPISDFPSQNKVLQFLSTTQSNLQNYPVSED